MSTVSRFLGYLNWLASPFHGLSTERVYDLIGMASPTRNHLYLNLGYWQNARDIDAASEQLALLVADAGQMQTGDIVLDCGFGFGDQDILWARRKAPRQIIGLNVTASQVARAREQVQTAGFTDRIDLREGSATDMPIPNESVDLVVALESAFHFDTREAFFAEAFRVLRPGGRLVTADILPMLPASDLLDRWRQRVSWYLVASRFNIPRENAYLADQYIRKLSAAGFRSPAIESIRDYVYAPLHVFLRDNPEFLDRQHALARLLAKATLRRSAANVYAGLDYVVATAAKPGASTELAD